jgi:hypothetical protein
VYIAGKIQAPIPFGQKSPAQEPFPFQPINFISMIASPPSRSSHSSRVDLSASFHRLDAAGHSTPSLARASIRSAF